MSILGQSPKPAEHGRFLQSESVVGDKVDFVQDSNFASGVLTLQAAGDATNSDFGQFVISFDYEIDGNIYPWDSVLAWDYTTLFVDGVGIDIVQQYRNGSSASGNTAALRKLMNISVSQQPIYVPISNYSGLHSHMNFIYMQNNDTSSHIMGLVSLWKYIVTGGPNG